MFGGGPSYIAHTLHEHEQLTSTCISRRGNEIVAHPRMVRGVGWASSIMMSSSSCLQQKGTKHECLPSCAINEKHVYSISMKDMLMQIDSYAHLKMGGSQVCLLWRRHWDGWHPTRRGGSHGTQ